MNKKGLYFGLAYSLFVIIFKLVILFGGFSLTHFGWYYSNITAVFMVIPFYILAIKSTRDKDYNGVIGGKEATRIALTVFIVGAVLVSAYNYFEFEYAGKKIAIEYYNSAQFLDYLKKLPQVKEADYAKIIEEQIKNTEVSAFKATTGKLFSYILLGLSSTFICAVLLKRNRVN
ncbi:MAG: DUF4199 domain-containing protein [Sphingobacteriaceae bacterium]|nr:DUF4199 domain-containing protein [Sphingobacteriaceae bacterium]